MTTFAPTSARPGIGPPDLTKHVNYSLGMVLGVDDFTQEFAYLEGRDRWLARDLIGYGTAWGLDVWIEPDGTDDLRVHVGKGAALSPCGRLVCVDSDQCASLNAWLAAKLAPAGFSPPLSPPASPLSLYVVLTYREALTDDVPIPGEPCRADGELMRASRVKDCFRIELRTAPPPQCEEDAVRDLAAWLRVVEITEGPYYVSLTDFLDLLRAAATVPATSPPVFSPPAFALGSPPASIAIPAAEAVEYLRAALRVWVTELRPKLRWCAPTCDCGCDGPCGCGRTEAPDEDEVLLGELRLPLVFNPGEPVQVDSEGWAVEQGRRPYLVHLRLLQELLLDRRAAGAVPGSPPAVIQGPPGPPGKDGVDGKDGTNGTRGPRGPAGPNTLVAAGRFDTTADPVQTEYEVGGLAAERVVPYLYLLTFPNYERGRPYVLTGVPLVDVHDVPHTFEVLRDDENVLDDHFTIDFDKGIYVRILPLMVRQNDLVSNADPIEPRGFEVEISDLKEFG
jgi:hypothetical protein